MDAEFAELAEIRDFLADYPPFSLLSNEAIAGLPALFAVRYQRRGSNFPPAEEKAACLYVVRKGAIELRSATGALIDKLGEGDVFDVADLGDGADQITGLAVEDTLLYLLPHDRLQSLRRSYPTLDEYFVKSTADRLRRGRHELGSSEGGSTGRLGLMTLPVGDFVRRKPVSAAASMSIRDAASLMTREGVSALLVVDGSKLCGIVTDRDLRSRCLAEGMTADQPIARIMSTELASIGPESGSFEALMLMTQKGIHHLPVVDAAGVCGLVSTTDLMRWQSANAVYLAGLIRKADALPAIVRASAALPELQLHMQSSGATPGQVGQAVSSINDAITCRLIELAQTEAELGPAPISFAWLACGSQGRHEQTVHTDQDNALILADTYDSALHGAYFEALALRVNDGLDACGYRYCPGKIMASNPDWCQPQAHWIEMFRSWITRADNMAAMLAANFLDLRTVYGDPSLLMPLHTAIKQTCSKYETFLARMVVNTLKNRPPLGFFRNLTLIADGEHADTFDIKRSGLIPITDLARIHALHNGRSEIGTVARLRAAAGTATLSAEAARELEEAFEYFGSLRLRHQAEQIRRGLAPDNYLSPEALTALEKTNLKEAFAVVSTMQKVLAQQYPHWIHE